MNNCREALFGKKVICSYCNKALRSFKTKKDWDKRSLHKKCYLEQQNMAFFEDMIKRHQISSL